MCWRDDIIMERHCDSCGRGYYGDLGHRSCPGPRGPRKEKEKEIPKEKDIEASQDKPW